MLIPTDTEDFLNSLKHFHFPNGVEYEVARDEYTCNFIFRCKTCYEIGLSWNYRVTKDFLCKMDLFSLRNQIIWRLKNHAIEHSSFFAKELKKVCGKDAEHYLLPSIQYFEIEDTNKACFEDLTKKVETEVKKERTGRLIILEEEE